MKNNSVIHVSNLGKAYRIGLKEQQSETLTGAIKLWLQKPLQNFKAIQQLKGVVETANDNNVFWANKNIHFSVQQGEVLGIIGKNGAGKSTLLKLLSRITKPTTGKIEIQGKVASLLEVGTGFNPELTGRENVYLNGTILGLTKKEIDERFAEIVDFSGVEQFLETPVKRYSSGMKVRLAFAIAANLDPEILIIDEVLAVGDAEFQQKCLGKLQSVANKQGRTVLFVSHDMAAIKNLCTRAILLEKGSIVFEGNPTEVVDYYLKNAKTNEQQQHITINKRSGSGKFIVNNMQLLNANMEPLVFVESGMNLNIKIDYQCLEKGVNPVVNIKIKNSLQQEIVNLLSRVSYNGILKLQPNGSIICNIPKLPLMQGNYDVDIMLKYDFDLTDSIEDVMSIQVEKGDFYGTGKIVESMRDGILVEHNWQTI
jgi:lipopolysaccharide transport system ATP-binding protein